MPDLLDVVVDFETFYDSNYSLRMLTMPEYILDPRFEIIGVSIGLPGKDPVWYTGPLHQLKKIVGKIPWGRCRMIAHNAMFDGAILEWILDCHPAKYLCTMMGSRPFVAPFTGSMSLDTVSRYLNLGVKGDEVLKAMGMRRADFTPLDLQRYGNYSCNDSDLSRKIAAKLDQWLPQDEHHLLDLTIKKFTRPRLELDSEVINARVADLAVKREFIEAKAAVCGVSVTTLRSRDKLAQWLIGRGIEVPMKTSKRTGKPTYAFAKDDVGMADLLISPDEWVRTVAEAKIFTSSTMEIKRLERFQTLFDLDVAGRHRLPVPLLYYGAHTGRLSGYDKINLQNLTRVKRAKGTSEIQAGHLRFALRAPTGYSIVAADLSNIEARIVVTLAQCRQLIEAFREGRDVYCEFASRIYGRIITKLDEIERFVGKTCILGLGYGMGWQKFGFQMQLARLKMADSMLQRIVWLYRDTYSEVPELWEQMQTLATRLSNKQCLENWGPLNMLHERFILPNGMPLIYPGVAFDRAEQALKFNAWRGKSRTPVATKLWGGAITENVVQALAKIVISTAELRLAKAGLRSVLQVHDELVYCVPTESVPVVTKAIKAVLCAQVPWLPDLPVACEIKHGPSYGDAK